MTILCIILGPTPLIICLQYLLILSKTLKPELMLIQLDQAQLLLEKIRAQTQTIHM